MLKKQFKIFIFKTEYILDKVYVEVTVKFSTDGVMMPVEFIWEDGEKYQKILDLNWLKKYLLK